MTVYNVKDSHGTDEQGNPLPGAQGDGITDDTEAIQRAVTAAAGGGVVFFPPGNYRVNASTPSTWSIRVTSNVTLRGSGASNTRIFQPIPTFPADNNLYKVPVVVLYNSPIHHDITIEDMTIDGGYTSSTNPGDPLQKCHGLDIRAANRITIRRISFINCAGDGVRINAGNVGTPPCTEILVENCNFDTIWRIGISLGRDFQNAIIRSCIFKNWDDFAIKAEIDGDTDNPTLNRGLVVTRCTCLPPTASGPANAGSISVYGPISQIFRDVTITHNMLRGTARFRGTHHTVFDGNTVLHTGSAEDAALDLWGNTVDFAARHNTLLVEKGLGFRAWSGESDNFPALAPNSQLVFSWNTVEWISPSPPVYDPPPMTPPVFEGRGVALQSALDAVVEGNILRGAKPGATAWPVEIPALQVALRNPKHGTAAQPPPPQRITLTHNIVEGYPIGIQLHDPDVPHLQSAQTLRDLVVAHNVLDRCTTGIALNRAELLERLMLSGHVVVQPPSGSSSLVWSGTSIPPYLIAGVHGPDAVSVGFFVGQGSPSSSVEPRVQNAAVGSLYLNSAPTGGQLWVREKSGGTPTWTPL